MGSLNQSNPMPDFSPADSRAPNSREVPLPLRGQRGSGLVNKHLLNTSTYKVQDEVLQGKEVCELEVMQH